MENSMPISVAIPHSSTLNFYSPILFQQLSGGRLHPEFGIQPVGKLELPWQWLRIFTLWCSIYEDALQMECGSLLILIGGNFH